MNKVIQNGKWTLTGFEDDMKSLEIFKAAFAQGLLVEGQRTFIGSSRTFAILKDGGKVLSTHQMRENWNGWNDLWAYFTEDWSSAVKQLIHADPSSGLHRNVVKIKSVD